MKFNAASRFLWLFEGYLVLIYQGGALIFFIDLPLSIVSETAVKEIL